MWTFLVSSSGTYRWPIHSRTSFIQNSNASEMQQWISSQHCQIIQSYLPGGINSIEWATLCWNASHHFWLIMWLIIISWSLVCDSVTQVGDKLPTAPLYEGSPTNKVDLAELFANKKGVIFAVPGAFTPGCSKVRLLVFLLCLSFKHKTVNTQCACYPYSYS